MSRVRLVACVALVGLAWASLGCAQSAEERQLAKMQEEIDSVEQPARLDEEAAAARRGGPPSSQRTLRLAPDGSEEVETSSQAGMSEAADDPNARPVLRVTGAGRRGGKETVEQTMPDENAAPAPTSSQQPSALNPEARKAYDAALALVNGKQYAQALEAFQAFLARYPDHPYASNAMYWRGECYFAQGDYLRAAEQFDGVVTRYPLGNKTPDALLKLGMTQQKLGNPQKAKEYFDKLQRDFPRSDAVRRIPTQGAADAARPKGAGPQENP